jgi:hypothetical protein
LPDGQLQFFRRFPAAFADALGKPCQNWGVPAFNHREATRWRLTSLQIFFQPGEGGVVLPSNRF